MGQGRRSGQGAPRVRSISNTRRPVAPQRTAVECQADVSQLQQHSMQKTALLDHLVGEGEQSIRDVQAKGLGSLEVYDQLDFRGLHDR
jgi:hypothetical protein